METLKARSRLLAILLFFSAFWTMAAAGKIAPELGRRTLRTAHFRVYYPPSYQAFAEAMADRLENSYLLLASELKWTPRGPIEVVLRGDIDVPNGSAEVFPYNRLVLNAVPPDPWGFFSESDDWIGTLAVHELTHVIANDETRGFFDFLRTFIGSAAKINPYQPMWLVEGLAVYEETTKTSRGRGRSIWNDMIVRTGLANSLFDADHAQGPDFKVTLDRLNDGVRPWPGPNSAYLYGYAITEAMASRGGADAPTRTSTANSGTFPFAIEGVARETLGTGYPGLWSETISRLRAGGTQDLDSIGKEPLTSATRLTSTGRRTRGFAASSGDRFYFIRDSERSGTGISVRYPTGNVRDLNYWRWDGGTRLRLTADGRYLVYSRYFPFLEDSLYSEVCLYDLKTEKEIQLTYGARAIDPEPSLDFEWDPDRGRIRRGEIYAVKNRDDANQSIIRIEGAPDGPREIAIYDGENFARLGAPALSPGVPSRLAFSVKGLTGGERIRILNLHDAAPADGIRDVGVLTDPRAVATTPDWDRDGSLLFATGAGGVFNLARISVAELAGKSPRVDRITNFTTGALEPTRPYPGAPLSAMVYGKAGWDLATVVPGAYSAEGPGVKTLEAKISTRDDPVPSEARVVPSTPKSPTSYSVFPALIPKYWAPDVRKVTDGWTYGVRTASYDAWENHHYKIFAGADSRASFPIWNLNYQFDGFYPTLELSVVRENSYFATYGESNQIDTDEANVYMPADWDSSVLLGLKSTTSRFFNAKETTGGFSLGWVLDHMRRYDDSIDAGGEAGVRGRAEVTGYFAGKERFSSFDSRMDLRIASPFRRHFFRIQANYAAANNEDLSALYYVGGGEDTIADQTDFLLRGYPQGTIFGRKILTSNFEYLFPVADIFRGFGTFPAYFQSSRVDLFFDAGSADIVSGDNRGFRRWPTAVGAHLLSDFNVLYRVPVTLALGFDYGLDKDLGGERRVVFGLYSRLP
jgi:hypothetical protein